MGLGCIKDSQTRNRPSLGLESQICLAGRRNWKDWQVLWSKGSDDVLGSWTSSSRRGSHRETSVDHHRSKFTFNILFSLR